ncbi:MAG: type II secretion system secretin GspD [Betaproteobacteria bacterium]
MNRTIVPTAAVLSLALCVCAWAQTPTARRMPPNPPGATPATLPANAPVQPQPPAAAPSSTAAAPATPAPAAPAAGASTPASPVVASPPAGAARLGANDMVSLSFTNTDIGEVARAMALITGRSVVLDPRVKGSVTLNTDRPVSKATAYNQFLAALRLQGFAVVETAGLYKVVPEAEAKLQGGSVTDREPTTAGNQIVTQIFRLSHESANNLVPVLRPLISPNNTINVNPGNNSLVVTDYADNLQRVGRIIAALDVPNASDLEIMPLKYAIASDLVPLVSRLIESQAAATGAPQGQADTSYRTTLLAEPRSNAVIIRAANPARLALARSLVERLDQPGSQADPSGNIHVVYLKNADATKLAITLRAALASVDGRQSGGASGAASPAGAAPTAAGIPGASSAVSQPSTGGQIQADPATNALIISAPEPLYRQLRAVIDQLDTRRAQVMVESLIVEVRADKAEEFGIQWQGPLGRKGDGTIGFLGTNFGSGGNNILTLQTQGASGNVAPGQGFNFGLFNRTGGVYTLGMLGRFLQESGDGNILSTPTLLTLDNEEAKIVVGQNVPFITGQYTSANTGTSGSVNPFQTIERRDVGLTLRVKPQISESGTVRLQIFQEVSSISPTVNSSGLITNKRSIESNVLVDDGSVVVLGGLLQDEFSGNEDKVPGLGDIPILGSLFRSETRKRNKSNLMVFLRPVVVRDAASSQALSMDRYDMMRGLQQGAQPSNSPTMRLRNAPLLPPAGVGNPPSGLAPTLAPGASPAPAAVTPAKP